MWIPSVFVILSKTLLLKWTTPDCKSATKFKSKYVRRQTQETENIVVSTRTTTTTKTITNTIAAANIDSIKIEKTKTTTTTTTITPTTTKLKPKQYSCQIIVKYLVAIVLLSSLLSFGSIESVLPLSTTSSLLNLTGSLSVSVAVSTVVSVLVKISLFVLLKAQRNQQQQQQQQFLLDAVITKSVVLMNDFWMITLFKTIKTTTKIIIEKTIDLFIETTEYQIKAIRTVLKDKTTNKISINQINNNNNNIKNNNQLIRLQNLPLSILISTNIVINTIQQKIPKYIIETIITPILPSINYKNNITVAALVILRLFNHINFSSNNHRTYNNSSKSNKVFLHYTPRDPRLRIFVSDKKQEICINKYHFESISELKITEDLCAYGELIGGSIQLIKTLDNLSAPFCDYKGIHCCCNNNRTNYNNNKNNKSERESECESECESVANNLIDKFSSLFEKVHIDKKSQNEESNEVEVIKTDKRQKYLNKELNFLRNFYLGFESLKLNITVFRILL